MIVLRDITEKRLACELTALTAAIGVTTAFCHFGSFALECCVCFPVWWTLAWLLRWIVGDE